MSKYTTGELAKLCNVTVRTVQYYDKRGILIPTELSEGGRRLYSESDLQRLQVICFLREVDVPIDAISQLLEEEHPEKVISILIEQQESLLMEEIQEKQEQLEKLRELQSTVQNKESFSLESIADIAVVMKGKKTTQKTLPDYTFNRIGGWSASVGVYCILDFQRNVVGICSMGSFCNGMAYLGM